MKYSGVTQARDVFAPLMTQGRYANPATNFNGTGQRVGAGESLYTLTGVDQHDLVNQFQVFVGRHGATSATNGSGIILIIPPSSLSYGSSQVVDTQFTEEGFLPTLWGPSQLTLSASGTSPAFVVDQFGLATPVQSGSNYRTGSLGYRHLMALMAIYKCNGYQLLTNQENSYSGGPAGSYRVIHVIDAVHIMYDGTHYEGHFNSFSVSPSASSPHRFDYTFEFTASGISGDNTSGHICDGQNQNSGIIIGTQGSTVSVDASPTLDWVKRANADPYLAAAVEAEASTPDTSHKITVGLPEFHAVFVAFMQDMASKGYIVTPTSELRNRQQQLQANIDYGFHTAYGNSYHNYGAAMDFNVKDTATGKSYRLATPVDVWENDLGISEIAGRHGLKWGGDFHGMKPDPIHVQLKQITLSDGSTQKIDLAYLRANYSSILNASPDAASNNEDAE